MRGDPSTSHRSIALALTALLAAVTAGALIATRAPSTHDHDAPDAPPFTPAAPPLSDAPAHTGRSQNAPPAHANASPAQPPPPHAATHTPPSPSPAATDPRSGQAALVVIGQGAHATPADVQPLDPPDWGALPHDPFGPDASWADPTQQEILGPPRWMAQPSEDHARELAAAIDAGPAPAELQRQQDAQTLRATAARLLLTRAEPCLRKWRAQQPQLAGRVIVEITIRADGRHATILSATTHGPIAIEESGLTTCVRDALHGASAPAAITTPAATFGFPLVVGD
jgi:hypothetical protein